MAAKGKTPQNTTIGLPFADVSHTEQFSTLYILEYSYCSGIFKHCSLMRTTEEQLHHFFQL